MYINKYVHLLSMCILPCQSYHPVLVHINFFVVYAYVMCFVEMKILHL